jgi:hypothetical protein
MSISPTSNASVGSPAPSTGSPPTVRCGLAQFGDVPEMVRFYRGLSDEAYRMYHPFPRNRLALLLIYSTLVAWQRGFGPVMRRYPGLIRCISVAHLGGDPKVVGVCTIRGERHPDLGWTVRAGHAVADGYRGYGIGRRNLRALTEIAVKFGIRWQIGSFCLSNSSMAQLMTSLGAKITPTDSRDSKLPDEPRASTVLDMNEFLRATKPRNGTSPPAREPAAVAWQPSPTRAGDPSESAPRWYGPSPPSAPAPPARTG